MKALAGLLALTGALALAGCRGNDESAALTIYSGREEELVAPLFEAFTEKTGTDVDVRYGDSAELAATLAEEGDNSPADVFFAQDPGALGAVEAAGLFEELPAETLGRVGPQYRDPDGRWVGTSGRARVIAYNTEALGERDVPDSVFDLTDERWQGKVGIAPTNGSFQAFVSAMRLDVGDERTRQWLTDLKANEPRFYEKNAPIVEALAAGEIDLGLVNHYYLALLQKEQPDAPVANHFLSSGDPGALVSVAGAGVLDSSSKKDDAEALLAYLLSEEGQRFYAEEAEETEYPVVDGVAAAAGLPPIDSLQGPDVDLGELGAQLESTLELLRETGYLT